MKSNKSLVKGMILQQMGKVAELLNLTKNGFLRGKTIIKTESGQNATFWIQIWFDSKVWYVFGFIV